MTLRTLYMGALVALTSMVSLGVYGHENEHEHKAAHMSLNHTSPPPPSSPSSSSLNELPYYFTLEAHKGWLVLHVVTMLMTWVGIMPIATMLSIANSRFHLPAQILLLFANGLGLFFSTVYHSVTPDLYPNNSHVKLGWSLLVILCAQTVFGILGRIVKHSSLATHWGGSKEEERGGFIPVATHSPIDDGPYRHSGDSGHGISMEHESVLGRDDLDDHKWNTAPTTSSRSEKRWFADVEHMENWLAKNVPYVFNNHVVRVCDFCYSFIARFLIPLAFVQICLGIITGSGIFMGDRVFNGLAHFIKGGIFFMYGLFTLGRWLGAFAEFGWAWNIKSHQRSRAPSVETIESALFFIYGCSNVFLEHLAGWGSAWTHSDLQHVSIAFMFFGGGLCGMLVESPHIRRLLNNTSGQPEQEPSVTTTHYGEVVRPTTVTPQHTPSFNPLPALVIFVLGIMMSSHHQHSAMSTTIHTQWGYLLAGGAVFRLITYLLYFRTPYTSTTPGRPPTELLAAFSFISGGLVFMASNKDTVAYLEKIGVDAMFSLTVTVGMSVLLMSWVVVVMALKGWAVGRELRRT